MKNLPHVYYLKSFLLNPFLINVLSVVGTFSVAAQAAEIAQVEAEDASHSGGAIVEQNHPGYSGDGFVGGLIDSNKGSAEVAFAVDLPETGNYQLDTRYANGTGSGKTLSLYLDGTPMQQVAFNNGSGWAHWLEQNSTVTLPGGAHTLSFRFTNEDSGNINLDRFTLSVNGGTASLADGETLQLEEATLSGGAVVETEHAGYTGGGFVGGFVDANKGQASAGFDMAIGESGEYALALRYANGTGSDRTLTFNADGTVSEVQLPAVGVWSDWGTVTHYVTLNAGSHSASFSYGSSDSGNVNLDSVALSPADPGGAIEPVPPEGGADYQAEDGFFSNGAQIVTSPEGYTGTGAVVQSTEPDSRILFTVNAAATGTQTVTFHFNNPAGITRQALLTIDGLVAGELEFAPTSGWQQVAYAIPLREGLGTLGVVQGAAASGGYFLDRITLADAGPLLERGATVGYRRYEAEEGVTNATVRGPSRVFHDMEAEASGRRAVRLDQYGQYVEITLQEPANAMVLRASIPDTIDGYGEEHSLGIYADGAKVADLGVSSYFSWVYGSYPYGNDPSQGSPQRYFDDSRIHFGQTLPAGTQLRLEKDGGAHAAWYDIDLVELELVGIPRTKPAGFHSITDYGATANDGNGDLTALQNAIDAARNDGTGVWVPQGRFRISDRVNLNDVTVAGAGPWYSVIEGLNGKGGFYATGSNVTIAHLMIDGDVRYRDDAAFHAALEGNFGTGSLLQNIWVEHTKVGLWASAGTDGLLAVGLRIRNTFADGVNLHTDVRDTQVTQSVLRNTGDDAMAMWSSGSPVIRSAFTNNSVHTPLLGNGAAIYGGTDNAVRNSVFADTLTGSAGIAVGTRFNPVPLAGTTVVDNNTLVRTGGYEPNWQTELGAVWVFADTADITAPVALTNLDILDSSYQGLLVSYQRLVENLYLGNVRIEDTGSKAIEINVVGSALFEYVEVTGAAEPMSVSPGFTLVEGEGIAAWTDRHCKAFSRHPRCSGWASVHTYSGDAYVCSLLPKQEQCRRIHTYHSSKHPINNNSRRKR